MKRLQDQSIQEKAKNLHELLPEKIPALIVFIRESTKNILKNPENFELIGNEISREKWLEIIETINEQTEKDYDQLTTNSEYFANTLFKGYVGFIILECIQEYLDCCNDEKMFKGIELFFD